MHAHVPVHVPCPCVCRLEADVRSTDLFIQALRQSHVALAGLERDPPVTAS